MTLEIPTALTRKLETIATSQHTTAERVALDCLNAIPQPGSARNLLAILEEESIDANDLVDELQAILKEEREIARKLHQDRDLFAGY